MKKVLCLLLALPFFICLSGCEETADVSVSYYYVHKDVDYGSQMPLLVEVKHQTSSNPQNYQSIINDYFAEPSSNDLASPFPQETQLKSFEISNEHLSVTLSHHIKELSHSRQTIAFACLTKTLTSLTGINSIEIIIDDQNFEDQQIFTFSNDSFLYADSVTYNSNEEQ